MRRALADMLRRLARRLDPPPPAPRLEAYVAAAEARLLAPQHALAEYDARLLPRGSTRTGKRREQ